VQCSNWIKLSGIRAHLYTFKNYFPSVKLFDADPPGGGANPPFAPNQQSRLIIQKNLTEKKNNEINLY